MYNNDRCTIYRRIRTCMHEYIIDKEKQEDSNRQLQVFPNLLPCAVHFSPSNITVFLKAVLLFISDLQEKVTRFFTSLRTAIEHIAIKLEILSH